MLKHGPVDVLVLAFGAPQFEGKVLAELKKRTADGTIRVMDAMVLLKDEQGMPWRLRLKDLSEEVQQAVGFVERESLGLFDNDDASILYEGMVPGSAVMALAIEHVWAIDLANAILDSGAELALQYRVPIQVVDEALAAIA